MGYHVMTREQVSQPKEYLLQFSLIARVEQGPSRGRRRLCPRASGHVEHVVAGDERADLKPVRSDEGSNRVLGEIEPGLMDEQTRDSVVQLPFHACHPEPERPFRGRVSP